MNRHYILILLAILAVVFISGCTGLPSDIFGSSILSIQQNVVQENPRDVLVIKNAQLIPSSPLLPDQDTTLTLILENKDNTKTADNVIVDLYNAPSFKNSLGGGSCNTIGCLPSECSKNDPCRTVGSHPSILPGEQRQITFKLKSPSESDIAGIKTETSLDYKAEYDFQSALVYTVPVVNLDEIIKRQRANEKTTLEFSKSHSSGPLKIDVEMIGAPYILSGQNAVVSFKINNIGGGTVKDSKIERWAAGPNPSAVDRGLVIMLPNEFSVVEKPENFECAANRCYNTRPIDIFRDQTMTSMRFTISPPSLLDVPLKSYTITAFVGYVYEMRDSIKVTVNPFQNV